MANNVRNSARAKASVGVFARLAPKLIDQGWPAVIPLRGKRPVSKGWQRFNNEPVSFEQLDRWCESYPDLNVGLPLGHGVTAIDIDVLDPRMVQQVAAVADELLGPTPLVRIGQAPKLLRLYRAHVESRKAHPLEVFGASGQVVIYGEHPDTTRPYVWLDAEPLEVAPEELPEVDENRVERFLCEASRLIEGCDRQSGARSAHSDRVASDFFQHLRHERRRARGGRRWAAILARQLEEAKPGRLHDVMISVVAAMVARGYSDTAIRRFFDSRFAAPRSGPFAEVWGQIESAIVGARRRWNLPHPTSVRLAVGNGERIH